MTEPTSARPFRATARRLRSSARQLPLIARLGSRDRSRTPARATPGRSWLAVGARRSTCIVRRRARRRLRRRRPDRGAAARCRVPPHARADEARPRSARRWSRPRSRSPRSADATSRGALFVDRRAASSTRSTAPLPELEEQAAASLAEAALLGEENECRSRAPIAVRRGRSARRSSTRRRDARPI